MNRIQLITLSATLAAAGFLAGCGGGGGSAPAAVDPLAPQGVVDLSATSFGYVDGSGGGDGGGSSGAGGGAGDGSPLRKAVVVVTDATGKSVSGLTDDNGVYFVKFSNFTSPIVAKVVDAGGNVLTSVTDESAVAGKAVRIMINPLTDKIVSDAVVSSGVPGTDKNFDGSKIDMAKLAQAKKDLLTSVRAALGAAGVTSTVFDPIKSPYAYDGTGVDALIESVSHTRDPNTGATQLRAKLVNVDTTSLITAATPLATNLVATPNNPVLTFSKLQAWTNEINRCLAITSSTARQADVACQDADGTRRASLNFMHNSKDFGEEFRTLLSDTNTTAVAGSSFRNPVLLFVGKYAGSAAAYDDLAVVEFTIRQPFIGSNGPNGAVATPVEYTQVLVFKRDDTLTRANAGNWILHGNQRNFQFSLNPRYERYSQQNPAKQSNTSGSNPSYMRTQIRFYVDSMRYDIPTKTYVNANIRAVRVTGPGLPVMGVVMTPSSVAGQTTFSVHNSIGQVDTTPMVTALASNSFRLNAVALDGTALFSGYWPTSTGAVGVGSGNAFAIPAVTDFSPFTAYSKYTFEFFLNSNPGNTTPEAIEYARILAPIVSPSNALGLPVNDLSRSAALVTAPQGSITSATIQWTNNLNSPPVDVAYIYAEERSPKGAVGTFTTNKWNYASNVAAAYSTNNSPTNAVITIPAGPVPTAIPSLVTGSAGDYREIGIRSSQGRAFVFSIFGWNN